jgi:GntR family transcriptional regulator
MDVHSSAIVISRADTRPMYVQIMEQIRQLVAVGDWAPGQEIPSIRQLAVDLRVSVITVKRAYLELEREGVIVTRQGKGSFVAEGAGLAPRLLEQDLAKHLGQALHLAAQLGLSPDELASRLRGDMGAAMAEPVAKQDD